VIEPLLGLAAQRALWSALFVAYAALAVWLAPRARDAGAPAATPTRRTDRPTRAAYWLLLSAAPAMALLAITNLIANEVGSVPLAWAAPLAVYLSTFMLAFRRRPTAGGFVRRHAGEIATLACIAATGPLAVPAPLVLSSSRWRRTPSSTACVLRRRGSRASILVVALGGWAGSAFVGLAAPCCSTTCTSAARAGARRGVRCSWDADASLSPTPRPARGVCACCARWPQRRLRSGRELRRSARRSRVRSPACATTTASTA
jgi:hypothetical protein